MEPIHPNILAAIYLGWFASTVIAITPPTASISNIWQLASDSCPPANVSLAADLQSFTVKYDLRSYGRPLAAMGPDIPLANKRKSCAVNFVLEYPGAKGQWAVILGKNSVSAKARLDQDVTGTIAPDFTSYSSYFPVISCSSIRPSRTSKIGPFEGVVSQSADIPPTRQKPLSAAEWAVVRVPDRAGYYAPLPCPPTKWGNPFWGRRTDDGSTLIFDPVGNYISALDVFEVDGPAGASGELGIGDEYSQTVSLIWLDKCPGMDIK